MTIKENRPGQLKTDKDFLRALQELVADFNKLVRAFNELSDTPMTFAEIIETPTTLSGYGIVDAAPLHHRHDWSDLDGAPVTGTEIVAWSSITGKPFTVDGFGIVDASKIGHKHAYTDILDPPPPGVGPPGEDGEDGAPGAIGPIGLSIPGLDGRDADEPLFIPGKDGRAGRSAVSIPGLDGRDAEEPMFIPGKDGRQGLPGAPGSAVAKGDRGLPGYDGIDGLDSFIPGPPGKSVQSSPGKAGRDGLPGFDGRDGESWIPGPPGQSGAAGFGFVAAGEYDPTQTYFPIDVVGYQGTLWWTKFGHPPGDIPGVAADWLEMLIMPKPRLGPPSFEIALPLEPLMIPGQRGLKGDAGAGGGGGGNTLYAPGSFTVATGNFAFHSRRLILTGAQRATLEGTATLRIT